MFWVFKFFVLESDLKKLKIDATTSTVNALLKQGETAAAKQKQSSTASSVSPEIFIDSEVPSGVETDKNVDILAAIMEKNWDKKYIQSLSKDKRENGFRLMVKSHMTEKRCTNPGCSFHKQKTVDLAKVEPGSLLSKLKSLISKEEINEFFEKRSKVREVFGNSQLLLNPLYMQCPICGSIISLSHFNDILQQNDKMKLHLEKSTSKIRYVHQKEVIKSSFIYLVKCIRTGLKYKLEFLQPEAICLISNNNQSMNAIGPVHRLQSL